jgi:hypothetical protein
VSKSELSENQHHEQRGVPELRHSRRCARMVRTEGLRGVDQSTGLTMSCINVSIGRPRSANTVYGMRVQGGGFGCCSVRRNVSDKPQDLGLQTGPRRP